MNISNVTRRIAIAALTVASLRAEDPGASKLWLGSVGAMAGANIADITTSRSLQNSGLGHETNGLLTDSYGRFSTPTAIALKGGMIGVIALVELPILRRHPKSARVFSVLNFAFAGVTVSAAVHNWRLK